MGTEILTSENKIPFIVGQTVRLKQAIGIQLRDHLDYWASSIYLLEGNEGIVSDVLSDTIIVNFGMGENFISWGIQEDLLEAAE